MWCFISGLSSVLRRRPTFDSERFYRPAPTRVRVLGLKRWERVLVRRGCMFSTDPRSKHRPSLRSGATRPGKKRPPCGSIREVAASQQAGEDVVFW